MLHRINKVIIFKKKKAVKMDLLPLENNPNSLI